jgi:DNA (cytosine-5)-methyltransferase 1
MMIGISNKRTLMDTKLKVLDLFSGIGGFSLGLERAGFETIAFCEIEPFCQSILRKHWQNVPIAGNIKDLRYEEGILYDKDTPIYQGRIDLICGGFPCQPFSIAGRKKGTADNRDLWPEMFRIITEVKPAWIVCENVAHFMRMAFERTKTDLESQGYGLQPFIIPACSVGAPHRRDRVWIIAHAQSQRCDGRIGTEYDPLSKRHVCPHQQNHGAEIRSEPAECNEQDCSFANADSQRCVTGGSDWQERPVLHHQNRNAEESERIGDRWLCGTCKTCEATANLNSKRIYPDCQEPLCGFSAFSGFKDIRRVTDYFERPDLPKPLICRSDDGFPSRVDRLKALGNSVVPQIPEIIGRTIMKGGNV